MFAVAYFQEEPAKNDDDFVFGIGVYPAPMNEQGESDGLSD